jgi:hypothetical protein
VKKENVVMSDVMLSPSAAFYVRASQVLGHGHGIPCGGIWEVVEGGVRVGDWPVASVGDVCVKVGLLGVHGLHKYYGSLSVIGGLLGWELSEGGGYIKVCHRTGSGRMSLWCMSTGGGIEEFGVKIHRGEDGGVVAWLKYDGRRWFGGWGDYGLESVLSRMDRFDGFIAIMYGTWDHDVEGMGTASLDDTGLFDVHGFGEALRLYKDSCVVSRRGYVMNGCCGGV